MEENTITLPSLAEIPEIMQAFPKGEFPTMPDFAIANGAFRRASELIKDGKVYYTGKIWTRNLSQDDLRKVATHDFFYGAKNNGENDEAESYDVCVMPRFQNPAALGIGLTEWKGHSVLTYNNKIAALPRWNVAPEKEDELWRKVVHAKQPSVGQYRSRNNNGHIYYHATKHDVYNYENESYALMRYAMPKLDQTKFANGAWCQRGKEYFYACRPVRAMRCEDGCIQCLDLLAPCRFEAAEKFNDEFNSRHFEAGQELDTDLFEIGQYLNRDFIQDLQRSTEFFNSQAKQKLSKLNANFDQSALRNQGQVKPTASEIGL